MIWLIRQVYWISRLSIGSGPLITWYALNWWFDLPYLLSYIVGPISVVNRRYGTLGLIDHPAALNGNSAVVIRVCRIQNMDIRLLICPLNNRFAWLQSPYNEETITSIRTLVVWSPIPLAILQRPEATHDVWPAANESISGHERASLVRFMGSSARFH